MLQSVTEWYRVLQNITEYYRVLQNITKTNLAHLLGPIFGLVGLKTLILALFGPFFKDKFSAIFR